MLVLIVLLCNSSIPRVDIMDSITNKLSLFDGPSIGREEAKAYIDSLILPNIYSTHKLINLIPHKTATFIS